MKYAIFFAVLLFGVPLMAQIAGDNLRFRGLLVGILPISMCLVKNTAINFVSMETYRGPDRGFEMTLGDLVALALAIVLVRKYPQRIVWFPPVCGLLALLYGFALLSFVNAPDKLVAAFSLWKWARAYGLFWVTVNVFRIPWPRRALWQGLVITATILTVVSLKEKYHDHIYRIPATFDHSNTVPLFINQFLPVLAVWGLVDKRLSNAQAAASLIACLGLCVASQSTFSRLGSSLSIGCFFGALVVANIVQRTPRVRVTTIVALVAVAVGTVLALPSIQERIRTAPEESEAARLEFNLAAKKMAEDNLFGIGVNNFSRVLTREARYNQFISVMDDEEQSGVCHHIYNLTAAELGKGGMVTFAAILVSFAARTLWAAWRAGKSVGGALQWGLLFGALALHVSGFAEWVFRITPVTYLFAFSAGMSLGLAQGGVGDLEGDDDAR